MYYERKKHDGSYPIVGVNTFRDPHAGEVPQRIELIRSVGALKSNRRCPRTRDPSVVMQYRRPWAAR